MAVNESDLHAYVDGMLPAVLAAEVELHLASHPEDAERVRVWRELNGALRTAFDPVLDEPVPHRLVVRPRV